jgi:hypothetical protein
MIILPKDFLSIDDVADYLNSLGYSYDLSVSRDHYKLNKDIYDLIIQQKINVVFHYTGFIKETICDNDVDEATGKLKNCTSKTFYTTVYFRICQTLAKKMLLDNEFTTTKSSFNLYCFEDGRKNPDVIHTFYLYDILDDNEQNITVSDLYVPKSEIDNLFDKDDQANHEQIIARLESELAQANAELDALRKQADTPADDKELPSNSQAGVARMLYAILTEHDYDLSPQKGKGVANDLIVNASNNHGTSVTRNFVADWLIRAREAKINNTK